MEILVRQTAEEGCRLAAQRIAALVQRRPDAVLGLATGSTPVGVYRELVRRHRDEGLDFSRVTTFNLDEYVGLEPDHSLS
jgi:glucosamine-6-phosphate deaminase